MIEAAALGDPSFWLLEASIAKGWFAPLVCLRPELLLDSPAILLH
jgi:hypothetical protein